MTKFEWFNNLTKGEKEVLVYHIYSKKPYIYRETFKGKLAIAYHYLGKVIR